MKSLIIFFLKLCALIKSLLTQENEVSSKVCLFGPPIISFKYIAESLNEGGYEAITIVPEVYSIHNRDDFHQVTNNVFELLSTIKKSSYVLCFYDSVDTYFSGVVLQFFFKAYIKAKNKKLIVMPYGSDAFEYSKLTDKFTRQALVINYPDLGKNEIKVSKRIRYMNSISSFVVPCITHIENLPYWDILPVHYYPIDLKKFENRPKKFGKFTIVHSPNHRGVKGTEFIIQAINELKSEGMEIDFLLLEKIKNDEVIKILQQSHLLIEQLVLGGYGLSAMEGMAAGIPVISNMRPSITDLFKTYSYLNECPIVSSGPDVKELKHAIRHCFENFDALSEQSSNYVRKHHSYSTNLKMWQTIFSYLDGKAERPINYFHPLLK